MSPMKIDVAAEAWNELMGDIHHIFESKNVNLETETNVDLMTMEQKREYYTRLGNEK
jgi:hypothetical protein